MINVICRANYTFGKNPQSQEKWLQGGNQKGSLGGPNSDSLPLPSPGPPSFWLSRPHSVPSTLQGTCLPRRRHRWWSRCQKWCCPSPVPALCQKHIRRSLNWLMDLYWFAGDIELRESLYIYISIYTYYVYTICIACLPKNTLKLESIWELISSHALLWYLLAIGSTCHRSNPMKPKSSYLYRLSSSSSGSLAQTAGTLLQNWPKIMQQIQQGEALVASFEVR